MGKTAYYGLPAEVRFCTRCVISNQRPSSVVEFKNRPTDAKPVIAFDAEGVCSACRYAEIKQTKIDWKKREEELLALCAKHRSKDGSYDCVIPGSGGKDSAFTSHVLKYKYGMNPLTVTWAPHVYTEIGWQNHRRFVHAGFDNILMSPNGRVHALLTRLAFENLAHPFQPFIIGQRLIAPRMSALYGIPLIFYGENQAEYGNNISENFSPTMKTTFFEAKPDLDSLWLGGVSARELIEKHGVARNDLNPYLPVDGARLKALGTEVHYLGYYLKWDPQECFYYASEHTGFQTNVERTEGSYSKYSSIDDKIDPLHYFTTYAKFGLGRASYDAAQEIRNGKITREEGVALVRRFDAEFPTKFSKEILEYMGIGEERFWEVIDKARSPHLWEKVDGKWTLLHQVS
ncbi:MAG: LPS biosynthesis protein [Elusimicrobia bacterium RBG_16_66_12]|nr:MAG: LPS biosynthesis protein [Elusimicrobia bacterium RBG_16_66_12]